MQTQKAIVTGQLCLKSTKKQKVQDFLQVLSPTVKLEPIIGSNDLDVNFQFEYGPVWGGWESDVRKKFMTACVKAGTFPDISITNVNRTVVETRA